MTNRRIARNMRKRRTNRRIPYSWSQPGAEERLLPDSVHNVALGLPVTDSHTHMLNLMLMMTLTMMGVMMILSKMITMVTMSVK